MFTTNKNNFWQNLKNKKAERPLLVLAPMADVTDYAFRKIISKYGKPDVLWTEFVSADGLALAPKDGKEKLMKDLEFDKFRQRPIIAQIFSANPEYMKQTAELVQKLGFDGLDINMGCPDRSIEKQLSGSAMIRYPEKAIKIINAANQGAPNLAISVKTRLGYNHDQLEEWLPILLTGKVAGKNIVENYKTPRLITFHARTRRELSKVPARWERIKRAVEIRDQSQKDLNPKNRTLIFGNGDIESVRDAFEKSQKTRCDGVMIGRGIFGKPWFFNQKYWEGQEPILKKRLDILIEHSKYFDKYVGHKNFAVMRKHFKAYVEGFDGAKELRMKLMESSDSREVEEIIKEWISRLT